MSGKNKIAIAAPPANANDELTQMREQLAEKDARIETLQAELKEFEEAADSKDATMEAQTQEITSLKERLVTAESNVEMLEEVNKNLTLQVEDLSNTPGAAPEKPTAATGKEGFTRNGKDYAFNFASMMLKGGRKISIREVLADETLQDELIAGNSTMIREEE